MGVSIGKPSWWHSGRPRPTGLKGPTAARYAPAVRDCRLRSSRDEVQIRRDGTSRIQAGGAGRAPIWNPSPQRRRMTPDRSPQRKPDAQAWESIAGCATGPIPVASGLGGQTAADAGPLRRDA